MQRSMSNGKYETQCERTHHFKKMHTHTKDPLVMRTYEKGLSITYHSKRISICGFESNGMPLSDMNLLLLLSDCATKHC